MFVDNSSLQNGKLHVTRFQFLEHKLPPASRTKYFLPASKTPRPPAPSSLASGSRLQYMEAASGSKANMSLSLEIPALNKKKKNYDLKIYLDLDEIAEQSLYFNEFE